MKTYMAKRTPRIIQISLLAGASFLWAELLIPSMLQAAPNIAARYVQDHGSQLVIEITTGSNPPSSAILIQHLPPGIRILASSPKPSNYNANKNRIKWLLRNPGAGKSTVSMTLDQAVKGTEISAEIRFKPAQGGKMKTIQVER